MSVVRDIALFVVGVVLVGAVIDSAMRTFVLPRGVAVPLTRFVSVAVRRVFDLRLRWAKTYEARDRVMALYGPIAMFVLVIIWIVVVLSGFMIMFVSIEGVGWKEAFTQSGSSLFTL